MLVKADVLRMIEGLPEDATVEDIQFELYLIAKAERGLQDLDEGRFVTHEQVKAKVAEWSKSSGPERP